MQTRETSATTEKRGPGCPPFLEIVVNLPTPPSTNALWSNVAGKGRVKTQSYREWREAAGWDLRCQRPRSVPGVVAVTILAGLSEQRRKRDADNLIKPLLDLITEHRIIDDDSNVVVLQMRWEPVVPAGRVLVEVRHCRQPAVRQRVADGARRFREAAARLREHVDALGSVAEGSA